MPGTTLSRGNLLFETLLYKPDFVWSSASLSSTTAELTTPLPGLQAGDVPYMMLVSSAMPTGLSYSNVRVSAPNTLAVTWVAASGGLTIPVGPWVVGVIRPEVTGTQLPTTAF